MLQNNSKKRKASTLEETSSFAKERRSKQYADISCSRENLEENINFEQWKIISNKDDFPDPDVVKKDFGLRMGLIFFILIENYLLRNAHGIEYKSIIKVLQGFDPSNKVARLVLKSHLDIFKNNGLCNLDQKNYCLEKNFIEQLAELMRRASIDYGNLLAFFLKKAASLYPESDLNKSINNCPEYLEGNNIPTINEHRNFKQSKIISRKDDFPGPDAVMKDSGLRIGLVFFIFIEQHLFQNIHGINSTYIFNMLKKFGVTNINNASAVRKTDVYTLVNYFVCKLGNKNKYYLVDDFIEQLAGRVKLGLVKYCNSLVFFLKKAASHYSESGLNERINSYPIYEEITEQGNYGLLLEDTSHNENTNVVVQQEYERLAVDGETLEPSEVEKAMESTQVIEKSYTRVSPLALSNIINPAIKHSIRTSVLFDQWKIVQNKHEFSTLFKRIWALFLENCFQRDNYWMTKTVIICGLSKLGEDGVTNAMALLKKKDFVIFKNYGLVESQERTGFRMRDSFIEALSTLESQGKNYEALLRVMQKVISYYPNKELSNVINKIFSDEFNKLNEQSSVIISPEVAAEKTREGKKEIWEEAEINGALNNFLSSSEKGYFRFFESEISSDFNFEEERNATRLSHKM